LPLDIAMQLRARPTDVGSVGDLESAWLYAAGPGLRDLEQVARPATSRAQVYEKCGPKGANGIDFKRGFDG
jgi:hypothetical protein